MWNRLKKVTESALPVSLEDAKRHLRLEINDDNAVVQAFINAAAGYIEGSTGAGIALREAEWQLRLDSFPQCEILIPLVPVVGVESITYIDAAGDEQTLDASLYEVDAFNSPARVRPVSGAAWPATATGMNKVVVQFTAGYETVPADLQVAILLIVGHFYENRENSIIGSIATELPMGADSIIDRYRVGRFS